MIIGKDGAIKVDKFNFSTEILHLLVNQQHIEIKEDTAELNPVVKIKWYIGSVMSPCC